MEEILEREKGGAGEKEIKKFVFSLSPSRSLSLH